MFNMKNPFEELANQIHELKELLLDNLSKHRTISSSEEELLTIEEAAQMLHIAVPTIYGLVNRRAIPFMKKSKRLYFSKKELTEWIQQSRRKTSDEIAEEAENYISGKRKGGKR